MRRIAVTGGNGQLGRHVVAALEPDYEVTVIDRSAPPGPRSPGPVDVLDLEALAGALRDHDAIVHLAAVDAAVDAAPERYFHTNTIAAWNVLHAGYEAGVRRFALCSSSSAYGVRADGFGAAPAYLPVDEEHPDRASDPYGLSKRACETVARGFADRRDVSVAVLRPCYVAFAPAVARMAAIRDAREEPPAAGRRPPLPPLRWFVAPEDAAACFRLAIEADLGFEVLNVGAADTFAAEPTLERVEALFGAPPEVRDPARFEADPHASPMDCSRAGRVLGWAPRERFADLRARTGPAS